MRTFEICYEVRMDGKTAVYMVKNLTKEEFEHIYNECERHGYKIVVSNIF